MMFGNNYTMDIINNSLMYRNILLLNENTFFHNVQQYIVMKKFFKNKYSYDYVNYDSIMYQAFKYDFYGIRTNVINNINNINIYQQYINEIEKLLKINYNYDYILSNCKYIKDINTFKRYEIAEINKIIYKLNSYINVIVDYYYVGKDGRKKTSKNVSYNFQELLFYYNNYNQYDLYRENIDYQRSLMTYSLRYDILKRDNFRCKICGASAATGAELEVDHIIPVSKGGKTTRSNLQTLCKECNRGKSNKL